MSPNADAQSLSGSVDTITLANERVYIGGTFTNAGGNPQADHIAFWDGLNWNSLGDGLNDTVWSIAVASNGDVYAGGNFTNAGGVPEADYIARWDGNRWNALGSGISSGTSFIDDRTRIVGAVTFGNDGDLYIAGQFVNAGGNANADNLARWDGSLWWTLPTENDSIRFALSSSNLRSSVAVGPDVYFGGRFLYRWDGTSVTLVSNASSNASGGASIAKDTANNVLISSGFINNGPSRPVGPLQWDGANYSYLGDEDDLPFGSKLSIAAETPNRIFVGGEFVDTADNSFKNKIAMWNGSTWVAVGAGINQRSREEVKTIALRIAGRITSVFM